MVQMHVFEYRFKNREMLMPEADEDSMFKPPFELPKWKYDDESRVFVVFVYNDGRRKDAIVKTDFSPSIIKGWKIYQLEKVKLVKDGMINDRKATFLIKNMNAKEKQRIDIFVKGPPEKVMIEVE
ncbi:MAG: hypothetical protein U9O96_08870 [Candidatus Thermoplasmatota archaeon]|nr:hypothetical protein [Candidatus Thermoplasmatota archaeon]